MISVEQWNVIATEINEPVRDNNIFYNIFYFLKVADQSIYHRTNDIQDIFLDFRSGTGYHIYINGLKYAKQHINKLTDKNRALIIAEILGAKE